MSSIFWQAYVIPPTFLTVKGYPGRLVQVVADADVVMALSGGHGRGRQGLSSRHLRGRVFVLDVPKGRSPGLRDRPCGHVLLLIIHPTPQR